MLSLECFRETPAGVATKPPSKHPTCTTFIIFGTSFWQLSPSVEYLLPTRRFSLLQYYCGPHGVHLHHRHMHGDIRSLSQYGITLSDKANAGELNYYIIV